MIAKVARCAVSSVRCSSIGFSCCGKTLRRRASEPATPAIGWI
jgi:hypothetical protein